MASVTGLAVEDRQQVIQRLIHRPRSPTWPQWMECGSWPKWSPASCSRANLDVDVCGAGEIGVDGGGLGAWALG